MKMIPSISIAALLLLAGAGCTSVSSSGNDEAKVVARILARAGVPATLAFKDQAAAQQLVSSLDTSEYFDFGVILDSQKNVFASYFRPDQISEKEKVLARVTQSVPSDKSETLIVDQGLAIAIVRMEIKEQTVGYVAIGRKGR